MREKLIELIQAAVGGCSTYWAGLIADKLLLHGVTVPVRVEGYSLNPNLEKHEVDFDYNAEEN